MLIHAWSECLRRQVVRWPRGLLPRAIRVHYYSLIWSAGTPICGALRASRFLCCPAMSLHPAGKIRPVYAYTLKVKVVDEIENGYLSLAYASVKYHVSRSTLEDWRKQLLTF